MNSNQHLIIFDLDETLIHSTESELGEKCDFRVGKYFVYKRPNVKKLLSYCMKIFNIAAWLNSEFFLQAFTTLFEKAFERSKE